MSPDTVEPFAAVPVSLLEKASSRLDSKGPLLTLIGILSYTYRGDSKAWPSSNELARRLGLTPRTVCRHILKLQGAGVLAVHPNSPTRARMLEVIQSEPDVPFGRVPTRVLEAAAGFGALPVCVYAVLAAYMNAAMRKAWPSQATIALHLNVSDRAVRNSLRLLANAGLIENIGYSRHKTVNWRVQSGDDAIWQATSMLKSLNPEVAGTGSHCPQSEAGGTSPGSDGTSNSDSCFRQLDNEETMKSAMQPDLREERAVLTEIAGDLGWAELGSSKMRLASDAIQVLKKQGYRPELLLGLTSLALSKGSKNLGLQVIEWVQGDLDPKLAEDAQAILEDQEEKFGTWPTGIK